VNYKTIEFRNNGPNRLNWQTGQPYLKNEVLMNKTELVKRVAEKLGDLPKKTAAKAVDAVFQSIQEGLEEDGIVKIGQWGTYTVDDI
jgi:uncharacterized protein (DUF2267 family)